MTPLAKAEQRIDSDARLHPHRRTLLDFRAPTPFLQTIHYEWVASEYVEYIVEWAEFMAQQTARHQGEENPS